MSIPNWAKLNEEIFTKDIHLLVGGRPFTKEVDTKCGLSVDPEKTTLNKNKITCKRCLKAVNNG